MADDETLLERLRAAWEEFRTCANALEDRDYRVSLEGQHTFLDAPFEDETIEIVVIHPPETKAGAE